MAVPLIIGEGVVGVLDMQSEHAGTLNQDVLPAFEALAGQIAIAIQNANFLAETERARKEVEAQARRLTRANWADYLDAIHQPENMGYVLELNQILPLTEETNIDENGLAAPITVTGETLGKLVVEMEGKSPISNADELLNAIAHQVSQQIESLRLLDSAERYRLEAENAARLNTMEGWKKYIDARPEKTVGYIYDATEVKPLDKELEDSALTLPIRIQNAKVGKFSVQEIESADDQSMNIAQAVIENLGSHIENLRLLEETRLGQIELDKRARQLAAVAEITTVSSRESDRQKMLDTVVYLTQRKFGLYHCHVFLYDQQANILKIAACGWKQGDIHEGTHGTAAIPLDQEQSLVARAARTQMAVIVNDVHNEPGWLANPLLPDTAAELAVPLLIGDRLLGVLDVQSDRLNAFTDEDANIQTTLASNIATALQNVYSFNQAQSALAESEKLFDASRNLTQASDLQDLVKVSVEAFNVPEIDRAILGVLDYDTEGELVGMTIAANWSADPGLPATPVRTHYPREALRALSLFMGSEPLFFADMLNDERVDEKMREIPRRLNYRCVAALPLFTGSRQDGMLLLEGKDPHNFQQHEIRLFAAMAPQIGTVLANRRQFEQAQKQAERETRLNAISQKIQSATTVEAVLQIAARELGHTLGAPLTIAQLGLKEN
jgi:GAF domain-containing protein